MIAKKETKQNGATNMVAAVSNILINIIMVRRFGLYAASISTLLAYLILVICRYTMIQKHVKLHIEKRSLLVIIVEILVFIGVYFNKTDINVVLLFLAMGFFMYINKNLIIKIVNTILKRS